jgi:hypothetical protein
MPVYVQHAVLGKIPDVFNAEAIWQAPGLALFARRPLLRDLLERNPREHKGRHATRCFTHVTLALPQEDVDDDYHLTRGARARDLAQTLAALHQKDFGDLLGADEVRYDIVGADMLEAGEIEVRFGHAVYLPAPDEKVLYEVSVSSDSAVWQPVCPIYPNQRLALIGAGPAGRDGAETGTTTGVSVPGWPFGSEGAILLVNDGPDAPPALHMRPKDAFSCSFDARSGYYTIRPFHASGQAGAEKRLLLKVSRVAGAPMPANPRPAPDIPGPTLAQASAPPSSTRHAQPLRRAMDTAPHSARAAVWQPRQPDGASVPDLQGAAAPVRVRMRAGDSQAAAPQSGSHAGLQSGLKQAVRGTDHRATDISLTTAYAPGTTALPVPAAASVRAAESDATFAPLAQQRVSLVALALPRLSRYQGTGAHALEIPFDRALNISAGGERCISFIVNAADELYAATAAGSQRISAPAEFAPLDARAIRLLAMPPEMDERYCATLCLAETASMPVESGARFVFGRAAPMLAALRVLDSPRFLRRDGDSDGASADRLGLSRSAFSFEAAPGGFQISRLAATQALYHLGPQLQFIATVAGSGAEAPYFLPAGHHLVAGHYVLRFEAP